MNAAVFKDSLNCNSGLAIAGGILLAVSFPKIGIAGAAWIAPGIILASALGTSFGRAFRLGYVAGLVHYLISLYWLLFMPVPLGAIAAWVALASYLALFPAVWVWFCIRMCPGLSIVDGPLRVRWQSLESYISIPFARRGLWLLLCAVAWVALEMIRARLLTGFPWNFLGVSQYGVLAIIQIASVTGVYGVSFLVAWFSVSLMSVTLAILLRPQRMRFAMQDLLLPLLMLALVCANGITRVLEAPVGSRTLRVALVQPSIPQTLIWDPRENSNRFDQLLALSKEALASDPDLLVWPEAAVPNVLRYEPESIEAVRELVRNHKVWLVLGADDAVPKQTTGEKPQYDYYNSAFLINPSGELISVYRKEKLVIFGEYVPLARWLPFLKYLTPIGEGFSAGRGAVPFRLPEHGVSLSVLICFEDAFPQLARHYVEPETDFLLNLTNNGWFGESAAQWQHAANSVFRAIENGLPLVRCGNNGLTCWVDPIGRVFDVGFPGTVDVYGPGFKTVEIPLLTESYRRVPTFYNRHGDWFGWSCVGAVASIGAFGLGKRWIGLKISRD